MKHNPRTSAGAAWVVVFAALSAGGCTRGQFNPSTLPAELAAPVTENLEAVDLSRLAHCATSSEAIDRGDLLDVTLVTNYSTLGSTTTPVRVRDDGMGEIPLIGPVPLLGLETQAAEGAIAAAAVNRGIFQRPHVTVAMRRQRTNLVTVVGAVKKPGAYPVPRGSSSLLAALVAAGGLAEDAAPEVEIRRSLPTAAPPGVPPAPPVLRVDLTKVVATSERLCPVQDGDVVMVSRRAVKPIYVIGLVRRAGEFKMPANQNLHVLDALALAGERSSPFADKVLVIRRVPGQEEPALIQVSVREAKSDGKANLRLSPGDIVSVEDTAVTFLTRTITDVVRFSVGGAVSVF